MTNEELLKAWNNNEPVTVIEMGGLGEEYEQAIYILMFAFLAKLLLQPIDFKEADKHVRKIEAMADIQKLYNEVGPSGAMVGAAWNAAFVFARRGYEQGLAMAPHRHIVVRKNSPNVYESA